MHLDHLDRLVEPGRLRGEMHHQDRPDGKVRRDQHTCSRAGIERPPHLVQALVDPAGRADNRVDPAPDAVQYVLDSRLGNGELDRDLGTAEITQLITHVEAPHQLQVASCIHRLARLAAHSPGSPDHRHPCRHAHSLPHRRNGSSPP
jgi:hypothetical protein